MYRRMVILAAVLMSLWAYVSGCVVAARPAGPVAVQPEAVVRVAPPPPREEVIVPAPAPGHVWVGGHWAWHRGAWVWEQGHWVVPPRHDARWVPGHWKPRGPEWVWVPGHWAYR